MTFSGKVEQKKKRSILCKQTLVHKWFQQREQFFHSSPEKWVRITTANLIPTAHKMGLKFLHCPSCLISLYICAGKSTGEATLRELAGASGLHEAHLQEGMRTKGRTVSKAPESSEKNETIFEKCMKLSVEHNFNYSRQA